MHFEILVEDQSGKKMLDIVVSKILGPGHTFKIHSYKGIGRIPKGLSATSDPSKRIFLDQLPRLLQGYGNTSPKGSLEFPMVVIVVCDLDDKHLGNFKEELNTVLNRCHPQPETRFCFAIEEGEAWLLGDIPAIKKAYPRAKDAVLMSYVNDSICGTWEYLANAIYPGGYQSLIDKERSQIGAAKMEWAEKISPAMDVNQNNSPSFCYFRENLKEFLG